MYNVLIVDDAPYIREGIRDGIPWQNLKIGKVQITSSAEEAFHIISREKPHIVITDIQMDEMSGLDLIRKVCRIEGSPKFIIISGYDYFKYAREAVELGVVNYLLKPIEEKELIRNIRECVEILDQENFHQKELTNSLKDSQELLLHRLFLGEKLCEEELNQNLSLLPLSWEKKYLGILLIEIGPTGQMEVTDQNRQELYDILMGISRENEHSSLGRSSISCRGLRSEVALIKPFSSPDIKNFISFATKVLEVLKKKFEYCVTIGLGKPEMGYRGISICYTNAKTALLNKTLKKESQIIIDDDSSIQKINPWALSSDMEISIGNAIRIGDDVTIKKNLHSYIEELEDMGADYGTLKISLFQLTSYLLKLLTSERDSPSMDIRNRYLRLIRIIEDESSLKKILEELSLFVQIMIISFAKPLQEKRTKIVLHVVNFIDKNYSKDISLDDVADFVHLNPSYLSRIFKEETGVNISHHLEKLRMEKARGLLLSTNMKVYEIASTVGYNNSQYFNRSFRKVHAMTPNEFRLK